jgi:hypothetical protein
LTDWCFSITTSGTKGVSEEMALRVLDRLADYSPAVSIRPPDQVGATFTVSTLTPTMAALEGLRLFDEALGPDGRDYGVDDLEVSTYEALETRWADEGDLVGVTEIAKMIGLSRQRAGQLTKRPDWPEPYARLASGPAWRRAEVEEVLRVIRPANGLPATSQTA